MSEDRRKNYRYPVAGVDEPAVLHRGGRNWRVTVTEKSAGGFRVVSPSNVKLAVGDTATLESHGACSKVRIAHITPSDAGLLIGLELLDESSRGRPHTVAAETGGALKSAVLVVVGAVAAAIAGVFLFGDREALIEQFDQWRESGISTAADASTAAPRRQSTAEASHALGRGFTRPVGLTPQRFRQELRLTTQQQIMIDQIVDETTSALRLAAAQSGSENQWSDAGAQIIRQSWLRVQNVLSPEQQQRWHELATPSRRPAPDHQALAE